MKNIFSYHKHIYKYPVLHIQADTSYHRLSIKKIYFNHETGGAKATIQLVILSSACVYR